MSPTPDETYDAALSAALTAVAAALAGLFSVYALAHVVQLGGGPRTVTVPVAAATAAVCATVAVFHHYRGLPAHLAHPVTAALVLIAVGNAAGYMVLVSEARQSTNVMLAVAGSGAVLLSARWLLVVLYLAWGAWTVGAFVIGPAADWSHYVVGMSGATVIALVVNHLRRSSVRSLADARAKAEAAAVRDQLTGVANRRGLAMVGGQMVEQARRQGDAVHCIFVDIDNLKRVNDALGHAVGDEVIVSVAEALRSVTRATDTVARWGGDEFCVVGPGPGMAPLELERRVRDTVAEHDPVPPEIGPVRVSAGGAMLAPWDAGTLETLLGKADQEMYLRRSLRKESAAPTPRTATAE